MLLWVSMVVVVDVFVMEALTKLVMEVPFVRAQVYCGLWAFGSD